MKWKNEIISLAMIIVMVGVSELFQSSAIIFPEIATLTIGGWVMARQPWQVSRGGLIILMILSAFVGVCLVRLPTPMVIQICLAFIFSALALTLTKSSITPIISTCILPVLLQETSFVYVLSVGLLSIVIVIVRYFLEQMGWVKPLTYHPLHVSAEESAHKWLRLLAGLFVLSLFATLLNLYYLIASPLIVIFADFYDPHSKWRRAPFGIWCLLTAGAIIGALCRFLFSICLGIPLVLCAALAFFLLFFVFRGFRRFLPPAGAITILPMLLPAEGILWYIPQVAIGAALLMILSFFLSKTQYKDEREWDDIIE